MSALNEPLGIPATVDAARAWAVVAAKLPDAVQVSTDERFHPFAGVLYEVGFDGRGWFRPQRVPVLVDGYGGRAYLTPGWPRLQPLSPMQRKLIDGARQKVGDAQARRAARTLAATAVMRKVKVGRLFDLSETQFVPTVWKPNWLVTARWRDQEIRVLVDGLDGSYYVAGSRPVDNRTEDRATQRGS